MTDTPTTTTDHRESWWELAYLHKGERRTSVVRTGAAVARRLAALDRDGSPVTEIRRVDQVTTLTTVPRSQIERGDF